MTARLTRLSYPVQLTLNDPSQMTDFVTSCVPQSRGCAMAQISLQAGRQGRLQSDLYPSELLAVSDDHLCRYPVPRNTTRWLSLLPGRVDRIPQHRSAVLLIVSSRKRLRSFSFLVVTLAQA